MCTREYTLTKNKSSQSIKRSDNVMDIRFIEIKPRCSGGKNSRRVYKYKRIRVEDLTKAKIKELFRKKGFKKLPDIILIENSLVVQFENKPALHVREGRIYVKREELRYWKTPIKFSEHQASILLDILRDYVEGFSYTTYHKPMTIKWE